MMTDAKKRRGPRPSAHVQLPLFAGSRTVLGSPELFVVTVAATRSGNTQRIRASVDARGYVSVWRDTGADLRAVSGWKGRWRPAGTFAWWRGGIPGSAPGAMHWGDHDALAAAIAARLAEVPESQIIQDQRPGWHIAASSKEPA